MQALMMLSQRQGAQMVPSETHKSLIILQIGVWKRQLIFVVRFIFPFALAHWQQICPSLFFFCLYCNQTPFNEVQCRDSMIGTSSHHNSQFFLLEIEILFFSSNGLWFCSDVREGEKEASLHCIC